MFLARGKRNGTPRNYPASRRARHADEVRASQSAPSAGWKSSISSRLRNRAQAGAAARWVIQEKQLGTGHAVLCAAEAFENFAGDIVILSGDVPLIRAATLRALVQRHREQGAAATLLTAELDAPAGYGRIVRDARGAIAAIVEEKD